MLEGFCLTREMSTSLSNKPLAYLTVRGRGQSTVAAKALLPRFWGRKTHTESRADSTGTNKRVSNGNVLETLTPHSASATEDG